MKKTTSFPEQLAEPPRHNRHQDAANNSKKIQKTKVSAAEQTVLDANSLCVAGGGGALGLSKELIALMDKMGHIKRKQRTPSKFQVDPLSITEEVRMRDPNLITVFGNASELSFYKYYASNKISTFAGNQLLRMITQVQYMLHIMSHMFHIHHVYAI